MKTISVSVSEPLYRDFKEHTKRKDRTMVELVREAMELYRRERIRPRTSVLGLKPLDLGKVLRPLSGEEDLLGEMLNAPRH
jgi:hypothetical protein